MAKSYKYKRSRKPLTLQQCQLRLTDSVHRLEKIILDQQSTDAQAIQAAHALTGAISRYAGLIETVELEKRITKLAESYHEKPKQQSQEASKRQWIQK